MPLLFHFLFLCSSLRDLITVLHPVTSDDSVASAICLFSGQRRWSLCLWRLLDYPHGFSSFNFIVSLFPPFFSLSSCLLEGATLRVCPFWILCFAICPSLSLSRSLCLSLFACRKYLRYSAAVILPVQPPQPSDNQFKSKSCKGAVLSSMWGNVRNPIVSISKLPETYAFCF